MYLTIMFIFLALNPFSYASLYLSPSIYLKPDTTEDSYVSTQNPIVMSENYGNILFQDEEGIF